MAAANATSNAARTPDARRKSLAKLIVLAASPSVSGGNVGSDVRTSRESDMTGEGQRAVDRGKLATPTYVTCNK